MTVQIKPGMTVRFFGRPKGGRFQFIPRTPVIERCKQRGIGITTGSRPDVLVLGWTRDAALVRSEDLPSALRHLPSITYPELDDHLGRLAVCNVASATQRRTRAPSRRHDPNASLRNAFAGRTATLGF